MNTPSAVEIPPSSSFKDALFKVVPVSNAGSILFWGALPAALLLLTIGVSFLNISPLSFYLPFLAIFGGVSLLRWKTKGLFGTYTALTLLVLVYFREIPLDQRLWQMGVVFALSVDFFILLLSIEEIDARIHALVEVGRVKAKELNQSQLQFQQSSQQWRELQQSLEEEIKQLKEEAEQRRIEKREENRRIELIQSEIELLTSQKQRILAAAKETCVKESLDGHTDTYVKMQEKIITLQQRERSTTEFKQLVGSYKQLRTQFDQKAHVLSLARKELFQTQEKLLAMEHEKEMDLMAPDREEAAFLEKELNLMIGVVNQLEEEILTLEGLVSHVLSQ